MKKLAIVIGGSSGIGLSTLEKLSDNYIVVNMSRRQVEDYDNIYTDVTCEISVLNSFKVLKEKYGVPSVMVYCSGFVEPQGILEIDNDTWDKTIATNLKGAYLCTQQFVKYAKNNESKIVYIASTAGTRPQQGWSAYASAKAGLINFALTMSEELKDYLIKVYCLSCGRCATPLRAILAPDENQSGIMQPSEVAELIGYLVSKDNLLDGQNLIVRK